MGEAWKEADGRIQTGLKIALNEPKDGWTDRYVRTPNDFDDHEVIWEDGSHGVSRIWCMDPLFADEGYFVRSPEHGGVAYWR